MLWCGSVSQEERSLLEETTQLWGSTHNWSGAGLLQEEHHHDGVACQGHPWH